ncbi:hypothetical protein ABPG72_011537 [Tetrahymena utriculariae]
MTDIYIPSEDNTQTKFKPDPFFNNFKTKTVQSSYRKAEQYLGWNCTGNIIATASNKIRLFRLNNSSFEVDKNEQKYHDSQTDYLSWHPTSPDLMAYITKQPIYYIWDIREKNPRKISNKVQPDNLNVIFSPDGNTISSCSRDNKLSFFDLRKEEEIFTATFDFDINEFQWDPSGSVIMIVGNQNQSGILHVCDGKDYSKANIDLLEKIHVDCHSMKIQCIDVDPKGKYFATGSTDTLVGLWDQSEFVMLKTFSQSDNPIERLSFSHDGQLLSSLCGDKTIQIYNCTSGNLVNIIERENTIHNLQWHPRECILAYLSDDKVDNEGNLRLYGVF